MNGASTDTKAMNLRILTGLAASAARLVPVPLLDDFLREKAMHLLVSRTLKGHGRTFSSSRVAALYADGSGCLTGCLLWLVLLPIKLIVYPFRKILNYVMAAKHLAKDLSDAVLLGRVLDRVLARGELAEGADPAVLAEQAAQMRTAFDNAVAGTDMKLLRGVIATALKSVAGLPSAAFHALRTIGRRPADADPTGELSSDDRQKLEAGASRVQSALSTPEMVAYLERFDRVFDENLRVLQERRAASVVA